MYTGSKVDIKDGIFETVTFIIAPKDEKSSKSRLLQRRGHVFSLWTLHRVESATFLIRFFKSSLSSTQKHKHLFLVFI